MMPAVDAELFTLRLELEAEARRRRRQREAAQAKLTVEQAAGDLRSGFHPQPGPQTLFAETRADVAIMGGAVHGGKTWALCYLPTRHLDVVGFNAVIFRRVTPEIRAPGSLWTESLAMYPAFGGRPREQPLDWWFGAEQNISQIKFAGLQHETDVLDWKGAQICLLGFDQLEEFTENQFWYMFSRNRSHCGVRPTIRATCNPDPDSWLAGFLRWWIDQETGYAIPERSGQVRWFVRIKDDLVWADSQAELEARYPSEARFARSVTFILARLQDNVIGNRLDPDYEAKVRAMPYVDQERLLGGDRGGNWKIRAAAGLVFDISRFGTPVEAMPVAVTKRIRAWDKAATPGAGDWTAGCRMSLGVDGLVYIEDMVRGQWDSGARQAIEEQTAAIDGVGTLIRMEQEPAASGKDAAASAAKRLRAYDIQSIPSTGDKVTRAGPFAAQVRAGNVRLIKGAWNEAFLRELHAFPTKGVPDDQVDAAALAYNRLTLDPTPTVQRVKVRWG